MSLDQGASLQVRDAAGVSWRMELGEPGELVFTPDQGAPLRLHHEALEPRTQLLSTSLHSGDHAWRLERSQVETARHMLLEARFGAPAPALPDCPWIEEAPYELRAWWGQQREAGEELLILVGLSPSGLPHERDGDSLPRWWLLSETRSELLWLQPWGRWHRERLPEAWSISSRLGRTQLTSGQHSWLAPLLGSLPWARIAALLGHPSTERARRLAAEHWRAGGEAHRRRALELSELRTGPWERLCCWRVRGGELPPLPVPSPELSPAWCSDSLLDWSQRWELTLEQSAELVGALRAEGAERSHEALGLHQALWQRGQDSKTLLERSGWTLAWSEHLIECEELERARELLLSLIAQLPGVEAMDLMESSSAQGSPARTLLKRALQLLLQAEEGGATEEPSVVTQTAAELVAVDPLDLDSIRALQRQPSAPRREQLTQVLAALSPDQLRVRTEPSPRPGAPLSEEDLEERVRHESTRRGGLLERLSLLLASTQVPDNQLIRAHCERLSPQRQPAASDLVQDLSRALGTGGVECYISHGVQDLGVRAYEGQPAFLLIGAAHLDPESPHHLSPSELSFALAAELAHLRFQHTRVRSADVLRGALSRGAQGLEILSGLLPLVKSLSLLTRVAHWMETPTSQLLQVLGVGNITFRALQGQDSPGSSLSQQSQELIAASRAMQFTADRAGLLASDDLVSACRALLLTHGSTAVELPYLAERGLGEGLVDPQREETLREARVRISALIRFWISADRAQLRAGLYPAAEPG